jgi:predicted nucleic acid-binding protein
VSLRFLLDTNVLSEPLRLRPDERILRRLEEYRAESAIAKVNDLTLVTSNRQDFAYFDELNLEDWRD